MKKDIQNADAVAHKLRPASIRITNHKLKVARKEQQKRKKIVERQKKKLWLQNAKELEEELICPVKRRRIMKVTKEMKWIQIKPAMTKTYCNSEKVGSGEAMSDKLTECHY